MSSAIIGRACVENTSEMFVALKHLQEHTFKLLLDIQK
jgi:hypothetical protein